MSGELEIQPADLMGRVVRAIFQAEEREDPFSGRRVLRLRVPYAGYSGPRPAGDPPQDARGGSIDEAADG